MDYLIIILTRHDIGERDLCFEHLATVHELNKQVADCLELHSFGRLNVWENQSRKYLLVRKIIFITISLHSRADILAGICTPPWLEQNNILVKKQCFLINTQISHLSMKVTSSFFNMRCKESIEQTLCKLIFNILGTVLYLEMWTIKKYFLMTNS